MGGIEVLLPEGCTLLNAPAPMFNAISMALRFLDWEELPDDERPPKEIWLDNEALVDHFKMVKRLRKQKYGGDSTPAPDDDDSGPVSNGAASMLVAD